MADTGYNNRIYDHRDTYRIRLIISAIAFCIFLLMFYLYKSGISLAFDLKAGEIVRSLRTPALNVFMINITDMGKWTTIVGIAVILMLIDIVRWHKLDLPLAVIAGLLNLGLYATLKRMIKRPRPDEIHWIIEEAGFSLPSGHSMNSMFCYGIMLYLLYRNCESEKIKKVMTAVICILILLIGFSRIYNGVHHPTDVMAGFSMGLSMLMIATVAIDEIMMRLNEKK